MEKTMRILLLSLLPIIALSQDNNKKGFVPNPKHTGPIYTGQEGKDTRFPNPNNQWGPTNTQSSPNYFPPHRKQDDCILS
jgi:hypothetical protein